MESTTERPKLLDAAKNFIRKSAGSAVLVIAPLAAVSVAPEAGAQTFFASPTTTHQSLGTAFGDPFNFSGGLFSTSGGTNANNITGVRFGTTGSIFTGSGGGIAANNVLNVFAPIVGDPINAAVVIPVAYDFTLTKINGISGDVNWLLHATITGDDSWVIGSGVLNTSSATFTGTGNYTVLNTVPGDLSRDFKVYISFTYTTAYQDELGVTMNAGQGFTINAAPIPEPSTYAALVGLGALGLVIVRRSRRARAA